MRPHKAIQHKLVKQVWKNPGCLLILVLIVLFFLFIRFNFCSGSFGVFSFFFLLL